MKNKKRLVFASIFIVAVGALLLYSCLPRRQIITSIEKYEKCLGSNGTYNEKLYFKTNIWPASIVDEKNVQKFYYEYYNPWDANFLGYMVVNYTDIDKYQSEISRLKGLKSTEYKGVYGIESFRKELCAIVANEEGMIYALTDSDNMEIDYVLIQFCNFFTDIKHYESIIDSDDLPIGLDILSGNSTRKKFDESQGNL